MKILGLVLAGLVLGGLEASAAQTYRCVETEEKAIAKGRLQYRVDLKITEETTDPELVGDADRGSYTDVIVSARDPERGGRFRKIKEFHALALESDVVWSFDNMWDEGVAMTIYMDEMDQTSLKLRGVKGNIQLNCGE